MININSDITHLPLIELRGTAIQMGEQLGEQTRAETQELYQLRLTSALLFAHEHSGRQLSEEQVLDVARRCLPITREYDPTGYDEFLGIARGAELTPEQLFVTQGLTDLRDVLIFSDSTEAEGCSAFIVNPEHTQNGQLLIGQTWDLQTSNRPYVRLIRRRPTDGSPHTWSLTLTGCLTLIALNSEGIAVGNTNLKTYDARLGVQYLSVLHRAIRARTFEEAIEAVESAPRVGAHYYYVADRNGRAIGLECSAQKNVRLNPSDGFLVHCNHALSPEIAALEVDEAGRSTSCRQKRMSTLLEQHSPSLNVKNLKAILSDHENGEDAICRHGESAEVTSTNACVIMSPETGEMHACRGQAHHGIWRKVS